MTYMQLTASAGIGRMVACDQLLLKALVSYHCGPGSIPIRPLLYEWSCALVFLYHKSFSLDCFFCWFLSIWKNETLMLLGCASGSLQVNVADVPKVPLHTCNLNMFKPHQFSFSVVTQTIFFVIRILTPMSTCRSCNTCAAHVIHVDSHIILS